MESVSGMRSPPVPSVSSACALISLIWAYFIVLLICQFSHSEICEQVSIISVAFLAHVDCQFFILKFWTNVQWSYCSKSLFCFQERNVTAMNSWFLTGGRWRKSPKNWHLTLTPPNSSLLSLFLSVACVWTAGLVQRSCWLHPRSKVSFLLVLMSVMSTVADVALCNQLAWMFNCQAEHSMDCRATDVKCCQSSWCCNDYREWNVTHLVTDQSV